MKYLTYKPIADIVKNEKGIALVTSLMLTLISLTIIMSLLYMITSSIQRTGATKRYKTVLEASYGGAEVVVRDIFPYIMRGIDNATLSANLQNDYSALSAIIPATTTQLCLQAKLTTPTASWPISCTADNKNLDAKAAPDIQLTLMGTNNTPFNIYSKIVDTVRGNSDTSGLQLEGAGVAEASSVITPQHFPYVYRLEIQGERSTNATEKSIISVLYAY